MATTAVKPRSGSEVSNKSEPSPTWPGPRKVSLQRNAAGFGFTLRHFIVYPPESAVAELSRQEGAASANDRSKKRPKITALEPMDTIFVKHVKPGGAAESASLSTGDRIVSVNGESVTGKTYSQVVGLIQSSDSCLKLLVVPREEDILQVAYPTSAYKSADGDSDTQPQPDVDSQFGGRSGIHDPTSSNQGGLPSPIIPVGKSEDAHDTVILHPDSDLLGHQTRHKTEMVLSVGSKPVKTSTPVYDNNWTSSRELLESNNRSTPKTGGHLDIAGRTGQIKQTDSKYGNHNSRPASGISVASSTSSGDSTTGQKSGRTFKITSIFGSHNRTQSQRGDPQRSEAINRRATLANDSQQRTGTKFPRNDTEPNSETNQTAGAKDQRGPVVRLRTGTGPNDYITLRGKRRGDVKGNNRPVPRQSNSMDNLASSTDAGEEVRSNNSGQVSSSYDNLHLSGSNGTEWEVRSGDQAMTQLGHQRLGSDSQVNRPETVTRRYYRSKQTETITTTSSSNDVNNVNAKTTIEMQGYNEVADPRMREMFMRQAQHQRHRRGYEKKEGSLSGSKSVDGIRYLDGRPMRSNTVSAADTRTPVSPTERRYSQFPDNNTRMKYQDAQETYSSETGQRYIASEERPGQEGRAFILSRDGRQAVNMVKIIGLDGNVQATKVLDGMGDAGLQPDNDIDFDDEEPLSPTKVQDRISYWDKKAQESSPTDTLDGMWRKGSNPQPKDNPHLINPSANPNTRYRITAHVPLPGGGRDRPPVPKRDSSRGRVRDRSMERERQHERKMYERHRSKSYDRSNQRSGAWFRSSRRQTTDDMSVDSLTSEGAISLASSRKESTASSISDGCSLDDDYPPVLSYVIRRSRASSEAAILDHPKGANYIRSEQLSFTRHQSIDEGTRQRLVRRTSYLRATLSDDEEEGAKDASSVADTTSISSMSAHGGEGTSPVVLRKNVTPRRNPSINKLKNLFGEGTPVIVEAIHKPTVTSKGSCQQGTEDQDVTREGPANIKVELKEWKRASDRSWKPVWMVLKNQTLYLMKERRDANMSPSSAEDRPISIKASMVDIAYDYTKKKNVFRLSTTTGSEYLIQVSDTKNMLSWITSIQANLAPGGDDILSANFIMHKTQQQHTSSTSQPASKNVLSPPNNRKKTSRSPSPALQQQPPPKKQSSGLAGKMKHKMKKKGTTWGQPTAEELNSLTFGVPLDRCTPSESNEFVPMFVDICCGIVEDIGTDIVGIYRVPGNTAGVTYLQDELKGGPEEANFGDSRWRDVNVVSSLLKMFFRKLPNPMVPKDQYTDFIEANRCKDPAQRMWALRRQIQNLSDHHYETFKFLANHLRTLSLNSDVNKMEVRNLAIVFGPTLVRSSDNSMVTMVTDMSDQCCIIESIIQHCDWFFNEAVESQQDVPISAMPETEVMSSDASELLSKARKDDQSGESGSDSSKGKDINPRDLMSSVISAANRKLKGRSTKKPLLSAEESDGAEYGFLGKGGEVELKVRAIRNQTTDKVGEEEDDVLHPVERQRSTVKVILRRDSHSSVETHSNVDSEVNYSDMETHSHTYNRPREKHPSPRGFYNTVDPSRGRTISASSESSMQTSSQGASGQGATGRSSSRKTVLKPDKDWKSEFARERQRIEKEHQKALRDYEKEDAMNVEELYRSRDYLREISAVSSKIANFASQKFTDEEAGGSRRTRRSMDTESILSDFSTASSNNNNTLHAARSDPVFNTKLEIRESPSESESDFVQTLKATFDERLQKVMHQENEEDRFSDKSSTSSKTARNDRRTNDGVYTASPYAMPDDQDAYRVRTGSGTYLRNLRQIPLSRTPTGATTNSSQPQSLTSRFNELSMAPQRSEVEIMTTSSPNSTSSSPTRSSQVPPRKKNYYEVILTLEKTGLTAEEPTLTIKSAPPSATKSTARESSPKRIVEKHKKRSEAVAKDTMSIKEQHRENRRRRHTVGGGRDTPEYRKIMEYNSNQESSAKDNPRKMSAFDRLKPFGKPAMESQPQNMKSWMDSERVRTNSSPNLLASVAMSTAPSSKPLSKPKSTSNLEGGKKVNPQKFSYV
ncbi:rho GTPase-activating protein 21-like isoform X2 [Asterias rubens]|uniref:rho GTPase-activating protein 21-like isoform X2 n=1 Tax=Asterias rubens TaxID=7604 RepID=UPI001454F8BE|nr:rho GTPase-activating protein 21-like isoform X2 [Asterias rubens]